MVSEQFVADRLLSVLCFLLGNSPGVWILYANFLEHTVCSEMLAYKIQTPGGITQKKACNIQNTAKVWNDFYLLFTALYKNLGNHKMKMVTKWKQLWQGGC